MYRSRACRNAVCLHTSGNSQNSLIYQFFEWEEEDFIKSQNAPWVDQSLTSLLLLGSLQETKYNPGAAHLHDVKMQNRAHHNIAESETQTTHLATCFSHSLALCRHKGMLHRTREMEVE